MGSLVITQIQKKTKTQLDYSRFDQINGEHPWRDQLPEGQISYSVRQLSFGKVSYFNFQLAKDMGLIPSQHPHRMNKKLEEKLLDTFNLRIINEYDIENKIPYPKKTIKPNQYMATRYLQLQHPNKQGKTSGDGRGIWNGVFKHNGKTWDVSSRGTGVTSLSPGSVTAEKFLKSGNNDHGYGCGLAEIDELYAAAILSEIFHINGLATERVLCIIDHGKGLGVGVRAGLNLIRPAHIFTFLKQNNYDSLKKATDYLIERQIKNKKWEFSHKDKNKYNLMLDELCYAFSQFTSQLERNYVFTWLDWDGDNVLADAGIIDYGSIRPMGLRHDKYRYDDVERFSTTLNEQKTKGRLIIQVFAQIVDFLNTKNKKPLQKFSKHPILKKFRSSYDYFLHTYLLEQMGFDENQAQFLMLKERKSVQEFYKTFVYFEKYKSNKEEEDTGDGVNVPPAFNMRQGLIELSKNLNIKNNQLALNLNGEDFLLGIQSEYVSEKDDVYNHYLEAKLRELFQQFENLHKKVYRSNKKYSTENNYTDPIKRRCYFKNHPQKITGNALIHIVNELLEGKKALGDQKIQSIIEDFIHSQNFQNPNKKVDFDPQKKHCKKSKLLMKTMLTLIDGHSEDI